MEVFNLEVAGLTRMHASQCDQIGRFFVSNFLSKVSQMYVIFRVIEIITFQVKTALTTF